MSKIAEVLKNHKKMFVPFITAGDPDLETTKKLILAMEEAGATIIELGIPFSDPMAEGPVIQEADIRALNAGTTTDKVFDMIKEVRKETDIPLVFLTYANPIFHYGTDKFYARCAEAGVDGTIVPDVPYEERGELETACEKYGVDQAELEDKMENHTSAYRSTVQLNVNYDKNASCPLFEKFLNGLALRNYKTSEFLPVFNLGLSSFRLVLCFERFPFLFPLSILRVIEIDHIISVFLLND